MVIRSRFAGRCASCGGAVAVGNLINWERGQGTRHADVAVCLVVKGQPVAAPVALSLAPVAAFLGAAKDRGVKFPKVRFLAPGGGEFRLSVAGEGSKAPGCIQVKVDDEWIGRVTVAGLVQGPLASRPELLAALLAIAEDPAAAAKAYGALSACCSFCNQGLTDEGSIEVGYGPGCAKNYGLPHTPRGSRNLAVAGLSAQSPAPAPVEDAGYRPVSAAQMFNW